MRVWCYNTPIFDDGGKLIGNELREFTDDLILEDYWDYWCKLMEERFGKGHYLINIENCIADWVAVNWAWEKV